MSFLFLLSCNYAVNSNRVTERAQQCFLPNQIHITLTNTRKRKRARGGAGLTPASCSLSSGKRKSHRATFHS